MCLSWVWVPLPWCTSACVWVWVCGVHTRHSLFTVLFPESMVWAKGVGLVWAWPLWNCIRVFDSRSCKWHLSHHISITVGHFHHRYLPLNLNIDNPHSRSTQSPMKITCGCLNPNSLNTRIFYLDFSYWELTGTHLYLLDGKEMDAKRRVLQDCHTLSEPCHMPPLPPMKILALAFNPQTLRGQVRQLQNLLLCTFHYIALVNTIVVTTPSAWVALMQRPPDACFAKFWNVNANAILVDRASNGQVSLKNSCKTLFFFKTETFTH